MATARVNLEGFLVREDIELDAGPRAAEASDGGLLLAPVVGALFARGEVAVVVAGAVEAAVSEEVGRAEVGADLLGGAPEVVDGAALVGEDVACGDEDVVYVDARAAVWEPQGVVLCGGGFIVGEAVEVPVCLLRIVS